MKLRLYTNNAYDTVALIDDDGKVTSHWPAEEALENALNTTDISEWDDQFKDIDVDEFEVGNDLFLEIDEDGSWVTPDKDLAIARLTFHLGEGPAIAKASKL